MRILWVSYFTIKSGSDRISNYISSVIYRYFAKCPLPLILFLPAYLSLYPNISLESLLMEPLKAKLLETLSHPLWGGIRDGGIRSELPNTGIFQYFILILFCLASSSKVIWTNTVPSSFLLKIFSNFSLSFFGYRYPSILYLISLNTSAWTCNWLKIPPGRKSLLPASSS